MPNKMKTTVNLFEESHFCLNDDGSKHIFFYTVILLVF